MAWPGRSVHLASALALSALALLGCALAEARGAREASPSVAVLPDDPEARTPATPSSPIAASLLKAHNEERARAEPPLPPLVLSEDLNEVARAHAKDMADRQLMDHAGADGSTASERIRRHGYHARASAENIAAGQPSVPIVMDGWMNSPGHRTNVLGPYREMGAARVKDRRGIPFWCVVFADPWPSLENEDATAQVIKGLNAARAEAEKPALRPEPRLAEAAQRLAKDAAASGKLSPRDAEGKTPFERLDRAGYRSRALGLSLGVGEPTPEDIVAAWLKRDDSRKTVLGAFGEVGIGYATSEEGVPYWCLIVAEPQARSR